MKRKLKIEILFLSVLVLVIFSSFAPQVSASSAAPGVGDNPPTKTNIPWTYYVKRPWIYHPSPFGDDFGGFIPTCVGVEVRTDFPYDIYLDGPNIENVWKSKYIKEFNLVVEEVISYEPLIYLESKSWYDHKVTIESLTSTEAKLDMSLSIGVKSDYGSASLTGGRSTTTVETFISRWSESVTNGQKKVIYVKMVFLHVYGTLKFYNNVVKSYDVLVNEAIEFENIEILDTDYESPIFQTKLYDGADYDTIADKFYGMASTFVWENIESKTVSNYAGIDVSLGKKTGFFLKGSAKITESKTNKFKSQHEFTNKGMPDNIMYYHIAFNNFYSVNIVPVIGSTGGGGGGGGSGPLLE